MNSSRFKFLLSIACAILPALLYAETPTRIAFLAMPRGGNGTTNFLRAVAPLEPEIQATMFSPAKGGTPLDANTDLGIFDVVFVDGATPGVDISASQIADACTRTHVVVIHPTDTIVGNVPLSEHPWLETYWANKSQDNYAELVFYLATHVAGHTPTDNRGPHAPIVYPPKAYYHPDAPTLFTEWEDFVAWYRTANTHAFDPDKLTVGITFYMSAYRQKSIAHIEALFHAIERRGHNVVGVASQIGPELDMLISPDDQPLVDVVITNTERLHLNDYQEGLARARRLGLPILSAISISKFDEAAFNASPTGLHPERTQNLVNSERDGVTEPIILAGRVTDPKGFKVVQPFAKQIEWRVDRALAWARLHRIANAQKRVVFTYWSEGAGKANVGGDPDDFLDVPASLVRLLNEMKARGYDTGTAPLPDRDALVTRMSREASNIGTWAPGELAARVAHNEVALLPEETYREWFDSLPLIRREEIVSMWGPLPGKVMVYTDNTGKRSIVIPKIQLGNILIAPNPDWGYLQDNKALMSKDALPPHHQYLAFFLWLQREWKADAWVPLFTNIVLQPGKSEGPSVDDHIGILVGALPSIHPERLGSNGGIGNKRKALIQVPGWYNIVAPSDATERLFELRAELNRYDAQISAELRAGAEPTIRAEIIANGLDRALELDVENIPFEELLPQIQNYLNNLDRANMPYGTKILGEAPTGQVLSDMVTGMLGADFRKALAPLNPDQLNIDRKLVSAVVNDGQSPATALTTLLGDTSPEAETQLALASEYAERLRAAPREIDSILSALEGHYLEPGPMDEPIRRPDAVPPGRSIYNFDQTAIPTPEAEVLGIKQAEDLIAAHREKHGGLYPTKLAFVLWSGEVAKNNGVVEAQIFHLLGTRAVRNEKGEVTGVELISRSELGRPRVDVMATTSGAYRDHFQDKVELITQATKLAAASPEADNPVRMAVLTAKADLKASGESADRAEALAVARVFSPAPGAYSPSIQFLAKSGDQRGDETRMAELYTRRLSHAYGGGLYGDYVRKVFEQNISKVDAAELSRSSNVNGMLDHPMSAGFLGGINLAAKAVTGRDVDLYVSKVSDPSTPTTETAARAIQTELHTRYFNPKWLQEMKAHGYDGARNLMFMTDHLDLWDSTATNTVSSADWAEVKAVYVDDKLDLQLDTFFDEYNPYAHQVLLSNLLGAASRGHWQASKEDLAQVARRLAQSTAAHGAVCEASVCRNSELTDLISDALKNAPDAEKLTQEYRAQIEKVTTINTDLAPAPDVAPQPTPPAATASAPSAPPVVQGKVIEEVSKQPTESSPSAFKVSWTYLALGVIACLFVAIGWWQQGRFTSKRNLNS